MLNTIVKAFVGNPKSLCALVSYDCNIGKHSKIAYRAIDCVVNKMGFANYKQYISSYPGNFEHNTITRESSKVKHYDNLIDYSAVIENKQQMKSTLKSEKRCSNLIAVPTIAEARKSYGFSLTSPFSYDLWFCSDWKEMGCD